MDSHSFWNKPRQVLLVLMASFFFSGLIEIAFKFSTDQINLVSILGGLLTAILCAIWCQTDAHFRGETLPRGTVPLVFLLPIVGIPLYLWRTRPHNTFPLYCLKLLGFVFLCGFLTMLGQALMGLFVH